MRFVISTSTNSFTISFALEITVFAQSSFQNKNFESIGELKISCTQWVQNNAFFLTNTGQAPKVSILNKQEGQIFNDQVVILLCVGKT